MAVALPNFPSFDVDLDSSNLDARWRKWLSRFKNLLLALDIADDKRKKALLLHYAGDKVNDIFDTLGVTETPAAGETHFGLAVAALTEHFAPAKNLEYETYKFRQAKQESGEDLTAFYTKLKSLAVTCEFADENREIKTQIIQNCTSTKLRRKALSTPDMTLNTLLQTGRAMELADRQAMGMEGDRETPSSTTLHQVTQNKNPNQRSQTKAGMRDDKQYEASTKQGDSRSLRECNFCGRKHKFGRDKCPAWGRTCNACQGRNHFEKKCKKKVNAVAQNSEDDEEDQKWLLAIESGEKNTVTALMCVNGCDVKFQLDSGAEVNTICQKYVRQNQVKPSKYKLTMWNKSKLIPVGEAILPVTNPHTGEVADVNFTVVDNGLTCLLGLNTVQKLGLITINKEKFIGEIKPEIDPLGDLGEAELQVDAEVKPRTLPCRRVPFSLKTQVKEELDRLVDRGVLVPISEPTEWVSQMAIVQKSNGKLRICIDPQPLNVALKREHYKLPTLDDVLPSLCHAKLFSKLDVKEAFWHVKLGEEASKLTTMITPFGRYRWARLPFGLKVSSEIFQKRLINALSDLPGVICVADDLVVIGCGETIAQAQADHDEKLQLLQTRCQERNIRLNEDKAEMKREEITFMGHRLTQCGIEVDPANIKAITEMVAPSDVQGVRRLCGMVQYLARFLPNLSHDLEPLRALTRNDMPWNWNETCEAAFNKIKDKVTETPVLAFYDPDKQLSLQVDSSKDGLGAVLLQDGHPVEYASRTLTPAERNWAQIEKEALAVLYGLERFDQYTYGRKVIVQNDHKPLASILARPLSQVPRRLQTLRMRLHRYDFEFMYTPGRKLFIADTLSRAFLNDSATGSEIRIMAVNMIQEIPNQRITEIRQATIADQDMQKLAELILNGWPQAKSAVPQEIRHYFDFRDTLSHDDGIIVKGERILVPKILRKDMKRRLHVAHLGYDSMMRRARRTIYWPGMVQEIQQMADNCETCQEMKPSNAKEPLKQHDQGSIPWNKIGMDLFEIERRNYLVVVDYFSSFIEVDHLPTISCQAVIKVLQKQFARFGIPSCVVSDNGTQFTAGEFEKFMNKYGIMHVTSSPGHQQANGKAEAAVKLVKNIMKKAAKDNTDIYDALLELRNTPRQDTNLSPADLMFGRQTQSLLPIRPKAGMQFPMIAARRAKRKQAVKEQYDKAAHNLVPLTPGQCVYYQNPEKPGWYRGTVMKECDGCSYIVEGMCGGVYRRNRIHLRPAPEPPLYIEPGIIPENRANMPVPVHGATGVQTDMPCVPPDNGDPVPAIPDSDPIVPYDDTTIPAVSENTRPKRATKPPAWMRDYVQK